MSKKLKPTQYEKYQIAVEQIKFEGEVLWQIMNTFMIVNTIYLGFITTSSIVEEFKPFSKFDAIPFIIGVIGFVISIA